MITIGIEFEQLQQISQVMSGDDRHMISRVFFSINVPGNNRFSTFSEIKQTIGAEFGTHPLEVSRPSMYRKAWNHNAFRDLVEKYYRSLIGTSGSGINVPINSTGMMSQNVVRQFMSAKIEASEDPGTW